MFATATVAIGIVAASASAYEPVGSDFRISNVGTDGDAFRDGGSATVAYSTTANEYMVAWSGDGLVTDEEWEIWGQRVSPAGAQVATDVRFSNVGTDTDASRGGFTPAIVYNGTANEYMVVWRGDPVTDEEDEIYSQRVNMTGGQISIDLRVSNVGPDGNVGHDAFNPAIAFNSTANEYLVVWRGDPLTDGDDEIYGQRVSPTGGELLTDFRISETGTDGQTTRDADDPAVTYNPTANQYLVTWTADDLGTDEEFEIFGQRISPAGEEVGMDFRISNVGTDGDAGRDADLSTVAASPSANEYLVAWQSDGLITNDEFEIFGQRISGVGAEIGIDTRISNDGTDADPARDAVNAAAAHSPSTSEYVVTWDGGGLPGTLEREVYGQRLSVTAAEVGGDFRISSAGTDGDPDRNAFAPSLALNPAANEFLVAWGADDLPTDDELEVFGRRLAIPPVVTPPPPPPANPTPPAPPTKKCKKKKKKKKKAGSAAKKCKKKKKKRK